MFNTPESIADNKLKLIKKCLYDTVNSSEFRMHLANIFAGIRHADLVRFIWNFNHKIRFIIEPSGDYCKDGLELLKTGFGDCEDFTVFNAAIFNIYKIPYRIKVTDTFGGGYFTHILVQYYDQNIKRWISFDGTYRLKGIGGEPMFHKERFYYI